MPLLRIILKSYLEGLLGGSVAQSVGRQTCSGHGLTAPEFEPHIRLCADSSEPGAYFGFCICPFPVHAHSLSQINFFFFFFNKVPSWATAVLHCSPLSLLAQLLLLDLGPVVPPCAHPHQMPQLCPGRWELSRDPGLILFSNFKRQHFHQLLFFTTASTKVHS